MTHDVDELRRELAGYAEQPEFTVTFEGVRQRAGRQRARRAFVVTGVAVIAALALAVPAALGKFGSIGTPPAGGVAVPQPEAGWHQVDDPIRTGLRGSQDGTEIVLWFERRDNGVTRLMTGERDEASGRVIEVDKIPANGSAGSSGEVSHSDVPGGTGFYVAPGDWSWPALMVHSDGKMWGLFVGDASRIDVSGTVNGTEVVRHAKLRHLSEDPRFVAFWADDVGEPLESPELEPVQGYDADGNPMKIDFPPSSQPPAKGEDVGDFDPAKAPQLGESIRTGEYRQPHSGTLPDPDDEGGEVVLSFHGKAGYAGMVTGYQDPDTGKVGQPHSGTVAYKLPFTDGTKLARGDLGLGGGAGHTLAYGVVTGSVDTITAKVDKLDLPVKTARWSEDPDVTVWWLVIPTDQVEEDSSASVHLTITMNDGTVIHD
jgi:hypothetical protein